MKTNYKSIYILILFLTLGLFTTSCNEENQEDPSPKIEGNTVFDNKGYDIKNGFYIEAGPINMYNQTVSHIMNFFVMTDGTPEFDEHGQPDELKDGKIVVMGALYSPGATGFKAGTYTYISNANDMTLSPAQREAKYKDKSFFNYPIIAIDTDGDKDFDDEAEVEVTDGTIKVSGTAPNYTVEYDFTIKGGKTLKGKFSGTFTKLEMEIDPNDDEETGG